MTYITTDSAELADLVICDASLIAPQTCSERQRLPLLRVLSLSV